MYKTKGHEGVDLGLYTRQLVSFVSLQNHSFPACFVLSRSALFTPSLFTSDVNNRRDTLPQDEHCLSVVPTAGSISPTIHEDYFGYCSGDEVDEWLHFKSKLQRVTSDVSTATPTTLSHNCIPYIATFRYPYSYILFIIIFFLFFNFSYQG